jgi:hypothetical protein
MLVFSLYRFVVLAGLSTDTNLVQLIDVILAWLVAEDDGAKMKIVSILSDRDEDLSLIRSTLQGTLAPRLD